jgi:DNA uptake protein ComE-like DNA-binding protein
VATSGGGRSVTALAGLPNVKPAEYAGKVILFYLPDGTVQWSRIGPNPTFRPGPKNQLRLSFVLTRPVPGLPGGTNTLTPFKIVRRAGGAATGAGAGSVGVEGLVNLNTAPLKVLQALPMVVNPATGRADRPADRTANNELAAAIVAYRENVGPFTSLFDLNRMVLTAGTKSFQNAAGVLGNPATFATFDPGEGWGDYSGGATAGASDGVLDDFESRYLMMTRLSNLVTTRSDTFTCYVLVQGWRGAGSNNPELVVQRRRAFIADRTGVTQAVRDVPAQFFYND